MRNKYIAGCDPYDINSKGSGSLFVYNHKTNKPATLLNRIKSRKLMLLIFSILRIKVLIEHNG